MKRYICGFLILPLLLIFNIEAQTVADPALLAEINRIKAIDNHAHPSPFLDEGEKDVEFDVPEFIPPEVLPVRLRGRRAIFETRDVRQYLRGKYYETIYLRLSYIATFAHL